MIDPIGLKKRDANHVPLSPISFLQNTARIHPRRPAVIYGERRHDWQTFHRRCARLAAALAKRGLQPGEVVSVVAANTPELLELHFAVPMAGGVLNAINTRLDTPTLHYIFTHGEAKFIFVDGEFADKVRTATESIDPRPVLIDILDPAIGETKPIGVCDYEALLSEAEETELNRLPTDEWQSVTFASMMCSRGTCRLPADEWDPIALNYTSGTTGNPKGVVYHHRGAYLMSVGSAISWDMRQHGVHLCTVPMFHCNGWCYPWTQALLAGTSICIRKIDGNEILRLIDEHRVDTLGGAPIVHSMIAEAGKGKRLSHPVKALVAGAPPSTTILSAMEAMGFSITHVYGLTETYGHTTICAEQEEWSQLSDEAHAEMKAQQGVGYSILQDWAVLDNNGHPLPADGETMGEIGLRGNTIMSGYLKNPEATEAAFTNSWFKTGDLAVQHPNGYLKIKDRLKDIIISGGENISSIAVENALCKHPAVLLAAVVARPDEKWGESPCAFIELREGATCDDQSLMTFCRTILPSFMCPKTVLFGELPKTATGKIKKYELRERAKQLT